MFNSMKWWNFISKWSSVDVNWNLNVWGVMKPRCSISSFVSELWGSARLLFCYLGGNKRGNERGKGLLASSSLSTTECLEVVKIPPSSTVWFIIRVRGLAEDGVLSHSLWLHNHALERTDSTGLWNSGSPSTRFCFHLLVVLSFVVQYIFSWIQSWCRFCTCAALQDINTLRGVVSGLIFANIPVC